MIIGSKDTALLCTLHALENSTFNFYLTGSRFFGTERARSDWDFFTQESEEVEKFLLKNDFKLHNETKYSDSMTSKVYRYKNQIDVQLVTNTEKKLAIQRSFFLAGNVNPKKDEWNTAAHRYDNLHIDSKPFQNAAAGGSVVLSCGAYRVHQV